MRGWGHEHTKAVLPRGTRAGGSEGIAVQPEVCVMGGVTKGDDSQCGCRVIEWAACEDEVELGYPD